MGNVNEQVIRTRDEEEVIISAWLLREGHTCLRMLKHTDIRHRWCE
jgi:hypothetical protein